jgi:hypothetical protein
MLLLMVVMVTVFNEIHLCARLRQSLRRLHS